MYLQLVYDLPHLNLIAVVVLPFLFVFIFIGGLEFVSIHLFLVVFAVLVLIFLVVFVFDGLEFIPFFLSLQFLLFLYLFFLLF